MPKRKTKTDVRNRPTLRKGGGKSSARVLRRVKAANRLCGAIESKQALAADGFRHRFAPELRAGEEVPDQSLALELAGRSVTRAIEALVQADKAYTGQCTRRHLLNEAFIGVAREQVYPELVDVRGSMDAKFGRRNACFYHRMEGQTPRTPATLFPPLERLVGLLENPQQAMPKPRRPGVKIDRQGWLDQLKPGFLKLKAMLGQLAQAEDREKHLRDDRDWELECFDGVYAEALDFVRSVFRLAGLSERDIWHLLPTVQRRRLRGKARQEREARAEGRRESGSARSGDTPGVDGADGSGDAAGAVPDEDS